ncbi:hypothetical protein L208DRAFT_1378568 [Tricholoma matsutake]|nr:hypothetical protein L208DRAFT_1378568 [Tricholoma matsutake 945]
MKKIILLTGLLFILLAVAGAQDDESYDESLYTPAELQRNAQRKLFGMPPIPPKAMRKKALKTKNKGSGMASLSSFQTSTGYIAIHDDGVEGPLLGYLSNHKIVQDIKEAVEYTYTMNGFTTEIMVAVIIWAKNSTNLHIFHVARHTTVSTAEGDTPFHDTKTASYLETAIFSIDQKTGEIEIEWVNPDGGRPPVQVALREERLYYTGDLSSFREYLGYDDTVKSVWLLLSWEEHIFLTFDTGHGLSSTFGGVD